MFVEQKALLVCLENMSDIIESMDKKFFLKALGSFSCRLPAEQQAERLLTLTERKKELLLLRINIYESLDGLKPECRKILFEKYGIDGATEDENLVKNRNYYRKLALATGKFAKGLEERGLNAEAIRVKAKRFAFIGEALERETTKSISSANFGILRNTSGKSLKPCSVSKNS